jgi:quercetin dioxygenase-like cupin family protein
VLSGTLRMEVAGAPEVTITAGQTFYEAREDVHVVSANASRSEPARFLVFMVSDKDARAPGGTAKKRQ